eukprot:TRINITY_DN35694_c0_g1_i1.p1 TRINITY_DN35694_c0_g1~~TRINITY_DN35694_c0_g1_i1.p1  ORF type:complete len:225 (-),score=36.74 TRINITY_DN35694_c0_g1_i1:154-828(-)
MMRLVHCHRLWKGLSKAVYNSSTKALCEASRDVLQSNSCPVTYPCDAKKNIFVTRGHCSAAQEQQQAQSSGVPSERVLNLADEVSRLTLMEVTDLVDVLRVKFDEKDMPLLSIALPGMGMPVMGGMGGVGIGGGAQGAAGASPKADEKQGAKEKSLFNVMLAGYDASAKIKIIKEVRAFSDLGLKEAKELVEKTPALLKKAVTKEEGEQIISKLKELGAKVSLE